MDAIQCGLQADPVSGPTTSGGRSKRWSAEARAACVRAWRDEGRQIQELAAEYRVTPETIRRWSRQMGGQGSPHASHSGSGSGFVALRLPEEVPPDGIRLRSPDGWVVELPAGSSPEWIIRLVRALRS
jgi:transposase-like protein